MTTGGGHHVRCRARSSCSPPRTRSSRRAPTRLPEAQLDRFMFKLSVPYPSDSELAEIARRTTGADEPGLASVVDGFQVLAMSALVRTVPLADHVLDYAVRLVSATQPERSPVPEVAAQVRFGASPRAVQALALTGKVRALLAGRFNVAFEDIRASVRPVLRHRLLLQFRGRGRRADQRLADRQPSRLCRTGPGGGQIERGQTSAARRAADERHEMSAAR